MNQFTFREPATHHEPPWDASRLAQLKFVLAPARWKISVQDVTARTQIFTDSDHYIVTADCRKKLETLKQVTCPKISGTYTFNDILARTLNAAEQIDISTVLQAIEHTAATCFTATPAAQRQPHISYRTWQKIVRRNAAHNRMIGLQCRR